MKILSLTLLVVAAGLQFSQARDVDAESNKLRAELDEIARNYKNQPARRKELQERLEKLKLPAEADEEGRIRAALRECDEKEDAAIVLRVHSILARLDALRKPEPALMAALDGDDRHPGEKNIGGVWFTGGNLVGYTVQLEQRGAVVSGQGYKWGCGGAYDSFEITGSYESGKLALTFVVSPQKQETHQYELRLDHGRPRFEEPGKENARGLEPIFESRDRWRALEAIRKTAEGKEVRERPPIPPAVSTPGQ